LVGPDGQQIGIVPLPEALTRAREADLDLVEVAALADPPVCRIMDYGKYKYEAAQKAKESRRKASNVSIKEMKYRPKISKGDFDTKTRKVERFLEEGHKVKVTLTFRGREMQHPELGRRIVDDVVEAVQHVGRVEIFPRVDGRNMTMVLAPDRKAQAASERVRRETAKPAETPANRTNRTPSTNNTSGASSTDGQVASPAAAPPASGAASPATPAAPAAPPQPVSAAAPPERSRSTTDSG
jgi:translation initiation factor IF-3